MVVLNLEGRTEGRWGIGEFCWERKGDLGELERGLAKDDSTW